MPSTPWVIDHRKWRYLSRTILTIGLLGPGLLLTVFNKTYGHTVSLQALGILPLPSWVYGIVFLLAGCLAFSIRTRDIAAAIGAGIYALFAIGLIAATVTGKAHSSLVFALPVVVFTYADATKNAIRFRDRSRALQLAEEPEEEL